MDYNWQSRGKLCTLPPVRQPQGQEKTAMPSGNPAPRIDVNDLPDLDSPVALHGARLDVSPCTGVSDDLWIIAVILVYEN
jgi:hypothetical protein